jgi:bifunctional DNA-binding transcriptional regulator/antitoxin component of YhaV-PrlF toxin-antitoxin module
MTASPRSDDHAAPATVRVEPSGAIILPEELRRSFGLVPGTEVVAEAHNGGIFLRSAATKPIWERIAERAAQLPPDALDRLPADGAAQIDHHIYGTPKRGD